MIDKNGFEIEKVSNFKDRLKTALELRGMTQYQLAKKTNIHKSLISRYVGGTITNTCEPKIERLSRIATVLNVSIAWLQGYDVKMEPTKIGYYDSSKLTDVDKVLGYGMIRELYEITKDFESQDLELVLKYAKKIRALNSDYYDDL